VVRVWTISAAAGVGARWIAEALAGRLDIPMLDRDALMELSGESGTAADVDQRVYNRLQTLGLEFAAGFGAVQAAQEISFLTGLSARGRSLLEEVGHSRCVIYAPSAAGALQEHDSALHTRLWAPFDWRVENFARMHMLNADDAKHQVKQLDRVQKQFASRLFDIDLDDLSRFSVAINARVVARERIVETLLGAGGATPEDADEA
jgi:hypothetical protein